MSDERYFIAPDPDKLHPVPTDICTIADFSDRESYLELHEAAAAKQKRFRKREDPSFDPFDLPRQTAIVEHLQKIAGDTDDVELTARRGQPFEPRPATVQVSYVQDEHSIQGKDPSGAVHAP